MLPLGDQVDEAVDVQRLVPERTGRDLAMDDQCRDVGIVGRDLAPALGAALGPDPEHAHVARAEGLDARYPHAPPLFDRAVRRTGGLRR